MRYGYKRVPFLKLAGFRRRYRPYWWLRAQDREEERRNR